MPYAEVLEMDGHGTGSGSGPRGAGTARKSNLTSYNYSSSSSLGIEDGEDQWTSWLVPMVVVANIAMFLLLMYINNCPNHHSGTACVARFLGRFSFEPLRENPLFGPSSRTLDKLGALEWTKIVHRHQGWRLITCIWLHAGIIHLLANMLSLLFIGVRLEQQFGFVRIGTTYLLSGFGGSGSPLYSFTVVFLWVHLAPCLGFLEQCFRNCSLTGVFTPIRWGSAAALLTLLIVVAINLTFGILPHVDNFAHIGGFLTGLLLGFILFPRPQLEWLASCNLPAGVPVKSKYKAHQYVLWIVSLVLLVSGLTAGLVMLIRGENGNDRCHWCHYLSCVSTSSWNCDDY